MYSAADVIYGYDGTFEGLLCCVFASYEYKEVPMAILGPEEMQGCLFDVRMIVTDLEQAQRVRVSIPRKISSDAYDFIRYAFLTNFTEKERYILLFLRKGYRIGGKIMQMLSDDIVHKLSKAVKHLLNESHLLKGFIRFSDIQGVLVAEIGPKNYVLPLLVQHFCERLPMERFVIYDRTHHMALLYEPDQATIAPLDELTIPEADREEAGYRRLWQVFYDAIEIEGRHNPKCRMNLMPKRYWQYMTEFQSVKDFGWSAMGTKESRQVDQIVRTASFLETGAVYK